MEEFKIKHFTIYKSNYEPEAKFRQELSKKLIEKFGGGPYSEQELVREAITFSYNYFCDKFLEICHSESSVRFYQLVLSQHEQAIEIALFIKSPEDFPEGIDLHYIALYRRILKWILEQACDIKLLNQEQPDSVFLKRAKLRLNELMFLGDMMFSCATLYAEQDMIEDVAEIVFDTNSLYEFKHKHHYDFINGAITESYGSHSFKHVADSNPVDDLKNALVSCFGIEYEFLIHVIKEIHKANRDKGGQYCGFGWESLPLSIESVFGQDPEVARALYRGLTLDRNNKLKLQDLVTKPNTLYRNLYRPILMWNIEGEDFAVVGQNGFTESIIQLTTNAIPWGKAPDEWMINKCFKNYVHRKEDEHDKWLDDEVEKRLVVDSLHYFRNVTSIKTPNGNQTLIQKGIGEIDFIIIHHDSQKIYVADCKHLLSRYDMINQKNDYTNFVKKPKGYNSQIENKIIWLQTNLENINYHYHCEYDSAHDISSYDIEGIFIINTPTFYMFNSDYRIYTVDVVVEIIYGRLKDTEFTIPVEENDAIRYLKIKYPYFKKPVYHLIDTLRTEV